MSTSILYGLLFEATDIFVIHEQFKMFRTKLQKLSTERLATLCAERLVAEIDKAVAEGLPVPANTLSKARRAIDDEQAHIEKTKERNPTVDFDFEVSLLPFEGKIYGMVRCEHAPWISIFKRTVPVKDFSYWDNTDKPSRISREDWNERERVWENIFKDSHIINQNSLEVICTIPRYRQVGAAKNFTAAVLKKIPSRDKRAYKIAKDRIFQRQIDMDTELAEARAQPFADVHISDFSSAYWRVSDWIKTDQGQCVVALEKGHLISLLPDITAGLI